LRLYEHLFDTGAMSTPEQLRHAEIHALVKRVQATTWRDGERWQQLATDWPEMFAEITSLIERVERSTGRGLRFGPQQR
jgi:hypothetical protein